MADNFVKRLFSSFVNKSHTHTYTLTNPNGGSWSILNGVFGYNSGKKSLNQYTEAYGDNPLVYMIIKKISFTSASIKRIAVNENDEEIENSVLLDILNNPNPEQGQIEFLEECNEYLESTGNTFVKLTRGIGGIGTELTVLPSGAITIVCNSINEVTSYIYKDVDGREHTYSTDEILHIKTSNVVNIDSENIKFGLSPLQAGWIVVKSSGEKLNAEASIFKNRGIVGMITNDTDIPMLANEQEAVQKQFNEKTGGSDKYNSIHVSNTKLRFVQTGMSPTDLKLLEGIVSSLRILCSIYGVSSVIFNDNENSTYNNVSEAVKAAYNEVYIPLANKVDKELSNFLNKQLGTTEYIKVDLTSIEVIKASTNEIAQAINSLSPLLATKVIEQMSSEEIRELINLGVLAADQTPIGEIGIQPTITTEA